MAKIKYGLSSVYYAIATIATNGSATYSTPVAWPGAVNLSMDANGDNSIFYADNIAYYVANGAAGYTGSLETALVPQSFLTDVLGMIKDTKGVIAEDMSAPIVHFALLFQFEGDVSATRHVLYNCTASRPAVGSTTKTDTVEVQTETVNLVASSVYNSGLGCDVVKAKTGDTIDSTTYNGWFSAVYQPTAAATT